MVFGNDNSRLFAQQSLVANHLIKDADAQAGVDGRHGVVQKVDATVFDHSTCQADSLPLASAQVLTVFLHPSQVAIGQPLEVLDQATFSDYLRKSVEDQIL